MTRTGDTDNALTSLAAETVGLAPDDPPDTVRAAICTLLHDEGFLPSPEVHDAIIVLSRGASAVSPSLREEARALAEKRLSSAVNAFAREFFSHAVTSRRARWAELTDACKGHDRAFARLRGLAPGLGLQTAHLHDRSPQVEQMIALALELFVQPPVERARNRLARVRDLRRSTDCRRAAKRFRRRFRAVARLVPELTEDLLETRPAKWQRAAAGAGRKLLVGGAASVAMLFASASIITSQLARPHPNAGTVSLPPQIAHDPVAAANALERDLRDGFKRALKDGLAQSGKTLGDEALQRVTNAQPLSLLLTALLNPKSGENLRRADRESLDRALRREGMILEESELTALADRVFPKSSPTKPSAQPENSSPTPKTNPVSL